MDEVVVAVADMVTNGVLAVAEDVVVPLEVEADAFVEKIVLDADVLVLGNVAVAVVEVNLLVGVGSAVVVVTALAVIVSLDGRVSEVDDNCIETVEAVEMPGGTVSNVGKSVASVSVVVVVVSV